MLYAFVSSMLGLDSPINILIETWLTMVESSCPSTNVLKLHADEFGDEIDLQDG